MCRQRVPGCPTGLMRGYIKSGRSQHATTYMLSWLTGCQAVPVAEGCYAAPCVASSAISETRTLTRTLACLIVLKCIFTVFRRPEIPAWKARSIGRWRHVRPRLAVCAESLSKPATCWTCNLERARPKHGCRYGPLTIKICPRPGHEIQLHGVANFLAVICCWFCAVAPG